MTAQTSAPGVVTEGASSSWLADTNDTPSGHPSTSDERPRCARRKRPLTDPRSIASGFGHVCWHRTELVALDRKRDEAGRRLAALARRVSRADLAELEHVGRALDLVGGEA